MVLLGIEALAVEAAAEKDAVVLVVSALFGPIARFEMEDCGGSTVIAETPYISNRDTNLCFSPSRGK
jgi:hypothetical protein